MEILLVSATLFLEAVAQRCSVKKVFLEFCKINRKHLCQIFFFNKIAKNIFSYRTPPVALLFFLENVSKMRGERKSISF